MMSAWLPVKTIYLDPVNMVLYLRLFNYMIFQKQTTYFLHSSGFRRSDNFQSHREWLKNQCYFKRRLQQIELLTQDVLMDTGQAPNFKKNCFKFTLLHQLVRTLKVRFEVGDFELRSELLI